MKPKSVDSISKLWSTVDDAKDRLVRYAKDMGIGDAEAREAPWFRGQPRAEYTLIPTLLRTANAVSNEGMVHQLYSAFKPHLTAWEALFDMQHFFVPTRLLDWTTDLATALYFAVNDDDCHVPSLYILHPCVLNRDALGPNQQSFLPFYPGGAAGFQYQYPTSYVPKQEHQMPIALRPGIRMDRIRAQGSMFTIHGADPRPVEKICPECLVKIDLDLPDAEMKLLRDLGRKSRDVFPDETGMARTLKVQFGLKAVPHSETVINEALRLIWDEDDENFRDGKHDLLHIRGLADCARSSDYLDRAGSFSEMEDWLEKGEKPLAIVLGPAANGKTNFLLNFALRKKSARLFLYCRLNDFGPGKHTLGEFLASSLTQMAGGGIHPAAHVDELTLESMVAEGRIVLILDGLDELVRIQGGESAAYLGTQIRRLTAGGARRSRIIIGCRDHIVRNLESKVPSLLNDDDAERISLDKIEPDRVAKKWGVKPKLAEVIAKEPLLLPVLRLAANRGTFEKASHLWDFWLDKAREKLTPERDRQELLNQLGVVATLMLKRRDDFLSEKQLGGTPELARLVSGLADRRVHACPLFVGEIDGKLRFAHQKIREYVLASNIKYGLDAPASVNVLTATSALDYESAETYTCLQELLLDANGSKYMPTTGHGGLNSISDEVRWNNFARNYFEAVGMLGVKNDDERRIAIQQSLDAIKARSRVRLKTKFNAARCLARLHPTSPSPYCEHASKASWPQIEDGSCTVVYGYAVRGFHQTRLKTGRRPPEVFVKEPDDFEKERTRTGYAGLSSTVARELLRQIERFDATAELRVGERFLQVNCAHALIRWLPNDETLCNRARTLMEDRTVQREARMNLFLALCVRKTAPVNALEALSPQIDGQPRKVKHFAGDLDKLCGIPDGLDDDY